MADSGMPQVPLRPGDPAELGAYGLLGYLGEGGMGVVYLAEAPDGRRVAIKVVRPEYAGDAQFRARFRREAESVLKVPRFCTAEVLDADPEAASPYLVTEYVDGPNLRDAIDQSGPLRSAELEQLGVSMAAALSGIHGAGVIHRDLKPSNVLLSRMGPRVIDFGIASALDATHALTATGQLIGTPAFMAPEQFDGHEPTPATDVFAWGGVMAYAASGKPVFGEGSSHTIGYRVVHAEPDLRELDGRLRDVVAAALDKDPARRPSARKLLEMLGVPGGDPAAMPTRVDTPVRTKPDSTRLMTAPDATVADARRRSRKGLLWGAVAAAAAALIALALIVVPALTGGDGEHELNGHWRGTYGDQYLLVTGKTVRMYYPQRDGRVGGTLREGVIRGKWSEGAAAPGGHAQFRVVPDGEGKSLRLDGSWATSSSDPASGPEWDLTRVDGEIPPNVEKLLKDSSQFAKLSG